MPKSYLDRIASVSGVVGDVALEEETPGPVTNGRSPLARGAVLPSKSPWPSDDYHVVLFEVGCLPQ